MKQKKYWFLAKKYGYGWYPSTWQGCLVIILYLVFVFLLSTFLPQYPIPFLIGIVISTVVLIFISYTKGEPARWRWG